MMKSILATLALSVLAVGLQAVSAGDIPLAVTTLAHPSLIATPTDAQLKHSDDYLKRGLRYLGDPKTYNRALEEFKTSVRMAPRAENYKALGTAYYQIGDEAKAAWAYRQSVQLAPNKELQALIDSLEGRDRKEEQFKDESDRLRYFSLLTSAKKYADSGRLDYAYRDYLDAYRIQPNSDVREPLGRAGIQVIEQNVAAKNYTKAGRMISDLRDVYDNAKNITESEQSFLKRLDKSEQTWAEATGSKVRKMQTDLETLKERTERENTEKGAKIKLEVDTR